MWYAIACMIRPDPIISYIELHTLNQRAIPDQIMKYKHSLMLHKLYNSSEYGLEWTALNFQHLFQNRQNLFITTQTNNLRVGKNIIANRLTTINNQIPLDWLNLSYGAFKVRSKSKFLM